MKNILMLAVLSAALQSCVNSQGKDVTGDFLRVLGQAIGGNNGVNNTRQPVYQDSDSDWDWDAFYDQYSNVQWRCRGIQTGQFSLNSNCALDSKDDNRWPGL